MPSMNPMQDWTHRQIGNYEIKELLGQGGMGKVYKGFHPALQRDVAIKMMRTSKLVQAHFGSAGEANERLRHEAQIVAGLRHSNIVQVHDFDIADETFYMVMEYVPGETLAQRLMAIHEQDEQMPLPEALRLFQTITQAVRYAHDQNVVHLDLKPSNVLLNTDNQPILADFGLSKIMGGDHWANGETISGSPAYMSPEQCLGETGDARSDIYSLGVMLYHMVTGSLPFAGDTPMALIFKHIDEPPPPARTLSPSLPKSLEVVLDTALRKNPLNRYESAQAMLEALDEVVVPLGGIPSMLLDIDATAQEDTRCPYRGLQTFEQEHAEFYFGREALVSQLLVDMADTLADDDTQQRSSRFLAVLGASGSGKSSLVRAGLIPALQTDGIATSSQWTICLMKPGEHPLIALAAQLTSRINSVTTSANGDAAESACHWLDNLADDGRALHRAARRGLSQSDTNQRLLLIVDQFEEVFTLCQDEAERRRFIENLIYAASVSDGPGIVLLTMRADFYHRCAQYRDLANRLAAHQMLVGAMDTAELRRAITQPAHQVGLKFEPGLVDTILADVARQPGSLPLLQHALLELWERRQGALLTLRAYQASDGVQGAIAQRADTVYQAFNAAEKAIAKRIMLRLTELGEEGSQSTSRRATRQELIVHPEDEPAVASILIRLADARLITTNEETVEVAHEALIREWPRLDRWLTEDQDSIRLHRHLTAAAQDWADMSHDPSELYSGARLASAIEWATHHDNVLNLLEREFLNRSQQQQQAEAEAKERLQQERVKQAETLANEQRQRAETQAKAAADLRQRAIWLTAAGILSALLAVVAVWFGVRSTINANERGTAQAISQREAKISRSRQLAAQAVNEQGNGNFELAVPLAIEAGKVTDTFEAYAIIREAAFGPGWRTIIYLEGHNDQVWQATWSQDENKVLTASGDHTARIWDAATGDLHTVLSGHAGSVFGAIWNKDESKVLTASSDGTARIWDAQTGQLLVTLERHRRQVWQANWNKDESKVLTAGGDGIASVWDANTGERIRSFEGHSGSVFGATWNKDESKVLTAGGDGTARIWNANTGQELITLEGHTDRVRQAMWSEDETTILTYSDDGTARIWDANAGQPRKRLEGHTARIRLAVWSQDQTKILTASDDGTTRIWDTDSGRQQIILEGYTAPVLYATWSQDEAKILTTSDDGAIRIWHGETGQLLKSLEDVTDPIFQADWSQDESKIVTANGDGSARIWRTDKFNEELPVLDGHGDLVIHALWNQDESKILTAGYDGTARIWDANTGQQLMRFDGHTDHLYGVVWSRDESKILTKSGDYTARIWDTNTGQQLMQLEGHTDRVWTASWNQNETKILTSSEDRTIRIWDANTGQQLMQLEGHFDQVFQAKWSQDESKILTAGADGTARIWDVDTGQQQVIFEGHNDQIWEAQWNRDESIILTISVDGTVRLWDADTGQQRLILEGHTGQVFQATWNHDESKLLTAGADSTVRIWDADTGQLIQRFEGHTDAVRKAIWNRDETQILTTSYDGTARIWDIETGQLYVSLDGHADKVLQAYWNDDETKILTTSFDGTARQYLARMTDLVSAACQRTPRNMHLTEWQSLMGNIPYERTCSNRPAHPSVIAHISEDALNLAQSGQFEAAIARFEEAVGLTVDLDFQNEQYAATKQAWLEQLKAGEDADAIFDIQTLNDLRHLINPAE